MSCVVLHYVAICCYHGFWDLFVTYENLTVLHCGYISIANSELVFVMGSVIRLFTGLVSGNNMVAGNSVL